MEAAQINWQAYVWNMSEKPYQEKFKGDMITIPPKSAVMAGKEKPVIMDFYDAVLFKGQYIPVVKNDVGSYLNEKRIQIEKIEATKTVTSYGFQNPLTGQIYPTKEALDAAVADIKEKFIPVREESTQAIEASDKMVGTLTKLTSTLEDVMSRLEKLETKPKGPGRWPKGEKSDTHGDNRRSEINIKDDSK